VSVADHAQLVAICNLPLAMPEAAAGFVSSASPCMLPLVPGYLAHVSGVSGQERSISGRQDDMSLAPGRDVGRQAALHLRGDHKGRHPPRAASF